MKRWSGQLTKSGQGHAEVYGYRKITMALRAAMWTVNAKKVLRHLRALGLTQPRKMKGYQWTRPGIVRPVVCNTYWEAELTLRVDRGTQFTAHSFREAARILNVRLEYAGIQCPEDKPYIESFFGSYKTEELYRREYKSLAEARNGWESYRAWYRNDRLHQVLWYKSPWDYTKITCNSKLLVACFCPI